MKLGITLAMGGAAPRLNIEYVLEAERLGFDQVWTGESYSTDAVTPSPGCWPAPPKSAPAPASCK